jgi:hypothetical protein
MVEPPDYSLPAHDPLPPGPPPPAGQPSASKFIQQSKWNWVDRNRYIHNDMLTVLRYSRYPRDLYHLVCAFCQSQHGTLSPVHKRARFVQIFNPGIEPALPEVTPGRKHLAMPEEFPMLDPLSWQRFVDAAQAKDKRARGWWSRRREHGERKSEGKHDRERDRPGPGNNSVGRKHFRRADFLSWAPFFISDWFIRMLEYVVTGLFGLSTIPSTSPDQPILAGKEKTGVYICALLRNSLLPVVLGFSSRRHTWKLQDLQGNSRQSPSSLVDQENGVVRRLAADLRREGWIHSSDEESDNDEGQDGNGGRPGPPVLDRHGRGDRTKRSPKSQQRSRFPYERSHRSSSPSPVVSSPSGLREALASSPPRGNPPRGNPSLLGRTRVRTRSQKGPLYS